MEPQTLATLTRDYLLACRPGQTVRDVLDAHAQRDTPPEFLSALLNDNPLYQHFIVGQRLFSRKVADWTEEDPNRSDREAFLSRRVIGLLGKTAVRNLVATIQVMRASGSGLPKRKGDVPELQPQKTLLHALRAETTCEAYGWAYPEVAFIGGLHYDWLLAIMEKRKAPREARESLNQAFKAGLEWAKIASATAVHLKEVRFQKFVFAAALLCPLGQGLLAITGLRDPSFAPDLTSLAVLSFSFVDEVEPAIRFASSPWMLASDNPDQRVLATILSLSQTLASTEIKPGADLPLREWQRLWLQTQGLSLRELKKVLTKLKEPPPHAAR